MTWLAATLLIAFSTPASATVCLWGGGDALIHNGIPEDLPADLVVAEVHIEGDDGYLLYTSGLAARVSRVVQGPVSTPQLILHTSVSYDCEWPFENGTDGLIVGRLTGEQDGVPILEPVFAPKQNGYRLEPGKSIPSRDLFDEAFMQQMLSTQLANKTRDLPE